MSARGKAQAFKNLKLDAEFFNRMLSRKEDGPEEYRDFDVYLMEKSVMPLLLQGLDALSRHTDKIREAGVNPDSRQQFNPLVWLAQYLLRNHPRYVKDHRTPMYEKFSELANIERGRRCLLRRRDQMEDVWNHMVEMNGGHPLTRDDLLPFFQNLDDKWYLGRSLLEKVPEDFTHITIEKTNTGGEQDEVDFSDFFRWFEGFVRKHDILRATAFSSAEKRQADSEKKAKKAQEDAERREKALQEALEQRVELEEQFEMVTADMYINTDIARIMGRGAVIEGVEEKEGGPPLQGEHIMLIRLMLSIWGCPIDDGNEDLWNDQALAAWRLWLEGRGIRTSNPVDKATLRRLIDKDEFQAYLQVAFPVQDGDGDEDYVQQVVEVKCLVEDELETLVEAYDEETGELLSFVIPESEIQGLRLRLETATSAHPVLATADRVSGRILQLMPKTQ
jgi:hypothetical protein